MILKELTLKNFGIVENETLTFNKGIHVFSGDNGCVDADTEFLSQDGWKKISEYKQGDKVLQYDKETNIAELVEPVDYIKHKAKTINFFKTQYGVNQCLSDAHNVLHYSRKSKKLSTTPFYKIKEIHKRNRLGFKGLILTTFDMKDSVGVSLTNEQLKVQVMTNADGSFVSRRNKFILSLKKKRKIERADFLLRKANIAFTKHIRKNGYTVFCYKAPLNSKTYNKYYYACSIKQLELITNEIMYWDGCFTRKSSFSSVNKEDVDFLQYAFAAIGKRTTTYIDKRKDKYKGGCCYNLNVSMKNNTEVGFNFAKIKTVDTVDGYEYCFTTNTGYLVLRREGRLFITGNSGKSFFLKAIALLLFNKTISTLKDYVMWDKKSFKISCKFIHMEKEFFISIKYDGATERILRIEGEEKPYIGQDVVEKLKEYFDPKIGLASMIAFEGETDLVNITDSERREMCKKIYSIDFNYQVSLLAKDIDNVDKQIEYLVSETRHLDEKVYNYATECELPFSTEEIAKKREDLKGYRLDREKILAEKQRIEQINNTITTKETDCEAKKISVKEYDAKIVELNNNITVEENRDIKKNSSLLKRKALVNFDRIKAEITNAIKLKKDLISVEEEKITTLPVVLNRDLLSKAYDTLVLRNTEIANTEALIAQKLKEIELAEQGLCPTCKQAVPHLDKEALTSELNTLDMRITSLKNDRTVLLKDKEKLGSDIELKEKVKASINTLNIEIQNCSDSLERNKTDYDKGNQNIEENEKKEFENRDKLISNWKTTTSDYEKLLEESQKALFKDYEEIEALKKQIPADLPDTSELDCIISDVENDISSYNNVTASNTKAKEINTKVDRDKEADQLKKIDYEEQREKLSIDKTYIEKAIQVLKKELPSYILSLIVKSLEANVNVFLESTYGGRYTIVMEGSRHGLKIVYGPKKKDVRTASGYERQVFSMAYKYAMGLIEDYKVLFLDEVDSQASDSNSKKFYTTVGDKSSLYNQLFVISHKVPTKELLEKEYKATVFQIEEGKVY